jgi:hypothetical protein
MVLENVTFYQNPDQSIYSVKILAEIFVHFDTNIPIHVEKNKHKLAFYR